MTGPAIPRGYSRGTFKSILRRSRHFRNNEGMSATPTTAPDAASRVVRPTAGSRGRSTGDRPPPRSSASITMPRMPDIVYRLEGRLRPFGLYPLRRLAAKWAGEYTPARIAIDWPERPNRVDFLNRLVADGNLRSYLEIGCFQDECFSRIEAPRKVGVDPARGGTIRATSRHFFATNADRFDLVFIDGLHLREQVLEDVRHALATLTPRGVVVLHDCLPVTCVAQYRRQSQKTWNGDVWKALVEIRTWPHVDAATCLLDHGLGILVPRENTRRLDLDPAGVAAMPYERLVADYPRLLRTVSVDEGVRFARGAGAR